MSLSTLSSVIEVVVKLSQCGRRKQAPSTKANVVSRDDLLKYATCAHVDDSCDAHKTTDLGEVSTTDASDGSEQVSGSMDESDAEAAKIKLMLASDLRSGRSVRLDQRTPLKPSKNLKTPPGLDAPPGLDVLLPASNEFLNATVQGGPQSQSYNGTRLNSSAALFVPSFGTPTPGPNVAQDNTQQLRQSIRVLKDALEEWEVNNLDQKDLKNPVPAADGQNLLVLQEALSRLTPQDAAMVRNLLETKEAEKSATFMDPSTMQSMPLSGMCQSGFPGLMPDLHGPSAMTETWATPGAMLPPGQFFGQPSPQMVAGWACPPGMLDRPVGIQHSFMPYQGASRLSSQNSVKRQAKPCKVGGADTEESLATHLRDLAQMDSGKVLMVRKINHLGGDTSAALTTYFAKFGAVERVMMSATRSAGKPGRVRPATLGFLVMGTAEAAQAALAHGEEHVVEGVSINISTFQSHPI